MKSKKVVVAMSGGIDSSVAAALLKDKGFEVIGITMQIWDRPRGFGGDGIKDAKRVAGRLKIPHYLLDLRDVFKKKIISDFCKEYNQGRTPNPCIRCNQYIKFDTLLKKAKELNADYIATGHYAKIEFDRQKNSYTLRKGIDTKKDQSYVLYMMSQNQLKHILMPLGEFKKNQVRQIAKDKKLPVADKEESQEICFIPDNNYGEFLKENIRREAKPGPVVNKDGKVIGEHKGIVFYTIGQRKGIGIADRHPLYVVAINKKTNTIVVGKKEEVYGRELIADKVKFINMKRLEKPMKLEAKIRYLHKASPAMLIPLAKGKVKVKFNQPQWAITPGQAVVFYSLRGKKGDVVIGGGTIMKRINGV